MDEDRILAALTRLESGQPDLQRDMASLKTDLAAFKASVDGRFQHVADQMTDFRVVVSRFERVEDRLTSMATDITVNMGAVDHAIRRQDNDRDELRSLTKLTNLVMSQVRHLQSNVEELQKKAS